MTLEVRPQDFKASRLAHADASVEHIVARGVLAQIPGAAVEFARVLAPGGVLETIDPRTCDREAYADSIRAGGKLKLEELRVVGHDWNALARRR